MKNFVSVIIPTYNRMEFIGAAIESVLNQTYPEFEILVIDDGSTDRTREVVARYKDSRLKYIHQANSGVSAARNMGIQMAQGKYLAFLDSDDLFLPDKLNQQVTQLDQDSSLGVLCSGFQFMTRDGVVVANQWPWIQRPVLDTNTIINYCPILINATLSRTEWIRQAGGFNPSLRHAEDYDLWSRLAAAGCRFDWTKSVLCVYRIHPQQGSQDGTATKDSDVFVMRQLFAQQSLPEEIEASQNEVISKNLVAGAFREYGAGQIKEAHASLKEAAILDPSWLENEARPFRMALLAWAVDPRSENPAKYIDRVLSNIPEEYRAITQQRELIILQAAVRSALQTLNAGNVNRFTETLIQSSSIVNTIKVYFDSLVDWLVDSVRNFPEEIQVSSLQQFFTNLPTAWEPFRRFQKIALARLYMARGFEEFDKGKKSFAARSLIRGIIQDPSWIKNRGVLAIIFKGLFSGGSSN